MYTVGEAEAEAVAALVRSGRLFRYPAEGESQSSRLEREWAEKFGRKRALAVNSGTSALICGLVGLGVAPGDEVIVPGYTFIATALAPLAIGAVPVLCEVDAALLLDPADLARKLTPRTKAIIPVHMNGMVADLGPILQVAHERGVPVLEDCCQCIGGSYRGKRVGAWGAAGAYSFNFFKILTCGEGGMLVGDDEAAWQRARVYHDVGTAWRSDAKDLQVPLFAGQNYRFDELRATVLRRQVTRLDGLLAALRERFARLSDALAGAPGLELAPVHDACGIAGSVLGLVLPDRAAALAFQVAAQARKLPVLLPHDSGRHVYWNWEPLMQRRGAYHPGIDPLHIFESGRAQRYSPTMLPGTRAHLERAAHVVIQPTWTPAEVAALAVELRAAARPVAALAAR